MSVKKMDEKIMDLWKNQMVNSLHPSKIVNKVDMERALYANRLLSILSKDWKEGFQQDIVDLSEIKELVKKYNNYIFNKEALIYMQKFLNYLHEQFPTKESWLSYFPLMRKQIEELFYESPSQIKIIPFQPKIITINPESSLFHTTNNFELFERKGFKGIPYGTTWFTLDQIYDPDKTIQFHADRGAMRVIKYKWITNRKHNQEEYPMIDQSEFISMPNIMDARKIENIPKESIEEYFKKKGIDIILPLPNLEKNLLSQYGRTMRPLVVEYLKSFGLDGLIVKDGQIAIFDPERWIRFDSIEQGDDLYLALSDLLNTFEHLKNEDQFSIVGFKNFYIPKIAQKNDVDKNSLEILFNINFRKLN
jgi:hypothetical protein